MKQIPNELPQSKSKDPSVSKSSKNIKKSKQRGKTLTTINSTFVTGPNLLSAIRRDPKMKQEDKSSEQPKPTPNLIKLFNEKELFLDQKKITLDMRLPSTRLMQDN